MTRLGRQEGSALLLALTLTLILAAAGAAAALMARMETLLAASSSQSYQALAIAEGGLARAIQELSPQSNWSASLSGVASTFIDGGPSGARQLPGGESVVLCCGAGSLTGDLQQRGHGGQTWGANTPQWRLYAWGPASSWSTHAGVGGAFYVVVWVADDVQDGDGDASRDSNGLIIVRSLALGPGRARRSVEATVRHAVDQTGLPLAGQVTVITTRESRW